MSTPVPGTSSQVDASLQDLLAVLARRRRVVAGLPLLLGGLTVAVTLLLPRSYSATLTFMPERPSVGRLSGLAGVAAQLGMQLPLGDMGLSPLFYTELLESRQFLTELGASRVPPGDSAALPLLDHLKIRGRTEALRRDRAAERLERLVRVTPDETVGLVEVRVRMRTPELALGVAEQLVNLINRFNSERRATRARAEREFADARQSEALDELRGAEARLLAFATQNRDVRGSPSLTVQRDRLSREVQVRLALYQSLRQAFEQARLEEVRDTPTITMVAAPQLPARPDSRRLIQKLALALATGLVLGTTAALWQEHRARGLRAGRAASGPGR